MNKTFGKRKFSFLLLKIHAWLYKITELSYSSVVEHFAWPPWGPKYHPSTSKADQVINSEPHLTPKKPDTRKSLFIFNWNHNASLTGFNQNKVLKNIGKTLAECLPNYTDGICSFKLAEKIVLKSCLMAQTYNPSTQDAQAKESRVQGQPKLHTKYEVSLCYVRHCLWKKKNSSTPE